MAIARNAAASAGDMRRRRFPVVSVVVAAKEKKGAAGAAIAPAARFAYDVRSTVVTNVGMTLGPVVSLSRRRNVPVGSDAGFEAAAMPTQYVVPPGRSFQ